MEVTVDIAIRPLTGKDVKQIVAIEDTFLKNPMLCMTSDPLDVKNSCESGYSHAMTINDEIIAYVLCYANEYDVAFVDKVFVKPKHRGRKLQNTLLMATLAELLKHHIRDIYSMVSPTNNASLRNFEAAGFKISHKTECNGFPRKVLKYEVDN
jgi:L-amino acid N-acyltransferase YncA